jgi:flagellar biogenesis protein FliO
MKAWRSVGLMAFLVTLLTAATLLAEPTAMPTDRTWLRQAAQRTAAPSSTAQLSLGKWAALALLLGLGGFAVWKRRQVRRSSPIVSASQIKIAGVTKLSPKAQLIVATVNGRAMLLGVTDSSINRLMWLDGSGDEDTDDDRPSSDRDSTGYCQTPEDVGQVHPNNSVARRTTGAHQGKDPTLTTKNSQSRRRPGKFRELLADAIGLAPRVTPPVEVSKAPVDELVAGTEDRYVGRDTRRMNTARLGQRTVPTTPLIDIEGQAAGLVARLNRSSP